MRGGWRNEDETCGEDGKLDKTIRGLLEHITQLSEEAGSIQKQNASCIHACKWDYKSLWPVNLQVFFSEQYFPMRS